MTRTLSVQQTASYKRLHATMVISNHTTLQYITKIRYNFYFCCFHIGRLQKKNWCSGFVNVFDLMALQKWNARHFNFVGLVSIPFSIFTGHHIISKSLDLNDRIEREQKMSIRYNEIISERWNRILFLLLLLLHSVANAQI